MKNTYLLLLLFIAIVDSYAQQFEMPIYFEDAIGNVDSVIIGYDDTATDGIDEQFGEVNTLEEPFDNEFEVRAGLYDWYLIDFSYADIRTIESKKFIVGKVCEDPTHIAEANSIMVSLKCNNWPIKVSWDKSLFQDECSHLILLNCVPGGWVDACNSSSRSFIYMTEEEEGEFDDLSYRFITDGDTLHTMYFPFKEILDVSVRNEKLKNDIYAYPNPSSDRIEFEYDANLFSNAGVIVYDALGRKLGTYLISDEIDVSYWENGVYLYEIILSDSSLRIGKFIVQNEG